MKRIAYYPGSFDPLTFGHLDILRQAFGVADEVIVGIGVHAGKTPMLDFEERAQLITQAVKEMGGQVRVESFDNLVVDAARDAGATVLVRGVRDGSDLDYELQMAGMNGAMAPQLGTIFFAANPKYRAITATLVRQIASMGGDVSSFVPKPVLALLNKKFE
ncbi:MAG: pantetheine-phosphate adenylyltransferase [Rhizobiaceae bacterium]|nr:pantetheine-phosphate adenylyltransferase [Rhizobiaceae bacterium]